jgi:hypothetical protein
MTSEEYEECRKKSLPFEEYCKKFLSSADVARGRR